MNLFGLMETSGSAMQAERMRAEVVAANMANAETTRTANGSPYRRQHVVFAANAYEPSFLESMKASSSLPASPAGAFSSIAAHGASLSLDLQSTQNATPGVHIAQVVEDPAPGGRIVVAAGQQQLPGLRLAVPLPPLGQDLRQVLVLGGGLLFAGRPRG